MDENNHDLVANKCLEFMTTYVYAHPYTPHPLQQVLFFALRNSPLNLHLGASEHSPALFAHVLARSRQQATLLLDSGREAAWFSARLVRTRCEASPDGASRWSGGSGNQA